MDKKKRIKLKVSEILRQFRVEFPPIPVTAIAEGLGLEVRCQPLEDRSVSGFLYRSDNQTIIGVNSSESITRQRFSVAHELGHFLLHETQNVHVDKGFSILLRDEKSSRATDYHEIEANQFAAELLMPEKMIRGALYNVMLDVESDEVIDELAEQFNVSSQALMHRLANLGIMGYQPNFSA